MTFNGHNLEIDKTLFIPKDEGFEAIVSYGPNMEISLDKEAMILEMVHASHGIYKTAFQSSDVRYVLYWFRYQRNLKRFLNTFSGRTTLFNGWSAEEFLKQNEFHLSEYGLLSDNKLLD